MISITISGTYTNLIGKEAAEEMCKRAVGKPVWNSMEDMMVIGRISSASIHKNSIVVRCEVDEEYMESTICIAPFA